MSLSAAAAAASPCKAEALVWPGAWKSVSDTAAFSSDVTAFLRSRGASQEVFPARVLQWPVAFAASNAAVEEALGGPCKEALSNKTGYAAFPGLGLLGPMVIFKDGQEHAKLRKELEQSPLASEATLKATGVEERIRELVHLEMAKISGSCESGQAVHLSVYNFAKQLAANVVRDTFFHDTELSQEEFEKLQSEMWRGTSSSGMDFNLMGFGRSAFSKAKQARGKLSKAALKKKSKCPFAGSFEADDEKRVGHALMFSSSMVTKALASLVCSFVLVLQQNSEANEMARKGGADLEAVLLEVERMYPPVIGCCRTTSSNVTIRGAKVKSGTKVWCSFYTANRDPAVYTNPDTFDAKRWKGEAIPMHFSFGAHTHGCFGKALSRLIVRTVCGALLKTFSAWTVKGSLEYRWLPVARPKDGLQVSFVKAVPEAQVPEAQVPEAQVPEAQVPEAQASEAQVPEAQAPEVQAPEAQTPEVQVPEKTEAPTPQTTPEPKLEERTTNEKQSHDQAQIEEPQPPKEASAVATAPCTSLGVAAD